MFWDSSTAQVNVKLAWSVHDLKMRTLFNFRDWVTDHADTMPDCPLWIVFILIFNFKRSKYKTHSHTQLSGGKLCANEIHITVGHWINFWNGNWYNLPRDLLWVVGHIYPVTLTTQCRLRNTFTHYQPINSCPFVPLGRYGLNCFCL